MDSEQQHKNRIPRNILYAALIFIGLLLLVNTNNNPNPIIQRIFRPIHIGRGTLYYAGLIPMILIYYSLKNIYLENGYTFLNTRFRRIVVLILVLSVTPTFFMSGVKLCKSFCNDLNSIYCYRNNMSLSANTTENEKKVVCRLDLENCSKNTREFYVKMLFPSFLKDIKEMTLVNNDTKFVLEPHERRQLEIEFSNNIIKNGNYSFSDISSFEFMLYNGLQEVRFMQND